MGRGEQLKRRLAVTLLAVFTAVVLFIATAFLLLDKFNFATFVAARASAAIERGVTIAELHVKPGRWLTVEMRGVQVSNPPGTTRPYMVQLASFSAEIEAFSLLRGPVNIRRLEFQGLSVRLEHSVDGTPNWRTRGGAPEAEGAENRNWFPTLRNVHIEGSEIVYRTSSGNGLQIRIEDATTQTDSDLSPVRLRLEGAYQNVPVTLDAILAPIASLRRAETPYAADLRFASGDTTLRFEGTMTKPLALDGATGTLALHAPKLEPVLAIVGGKHNLKASVDISGTLTRSDARWVLAEATGKLDDSTVAALTLHLTDGGRGHPDSIELDLAFDNLELAPLLASSGPSNSTGTPFSIDRAPDPLLHARLTARRLSYKRYETTNLETVVVIAPGQIRVENFAMTVSGARLQAFAHADATDHGGRVSAETSVSDVDVQQLRRQLGVATLPVEGRLDAQAIFESEGTTLEAAAKSAHAWAVVWMPVGSISRDLIEKLSTDTRRLFRAPVGMSALSCMIGIINMRSGVAIVAPLRIRTPQGTIAGQGIVDLNRQQLDMTVGSQSATTSAFALDVPFRISGALSDPIVRPSTSKPALATANLNELPLSLRQVVQHNPCTSPR